MLCGKKMREIDFVDIRGKCSFHILFSLLYCYRASKSNISTLNPNLSLAIYVSYHKGLVIIMNIMWFDLGWW